VPAAHALELRPQAVLQHLAVVAADVLRLQQNRVPQQRPHEQSCHALLLLLLMLMLLLIHGSFL
jgi:hypothetical protein